jgi:phosphoglycolate phosphatase
MIHIKRPIPAAQIKLLVWDMDGTLVDSALDLALAINAMLRHLKRPELPVELITSYIGNGITDLVRRSLGDTNDDALIQTGLAYFVPYYDDHKLDHTHVYAGVMEMLKTIQKQTSLHMAILTNKSAGLSRGVSDGLELTAFMSEICGGDSFPTRKPDPHGVRALMAEHGALPTEAIMIGDSQNDILTANNAGMFSVGVTYGLSPDSLKLHPPDVMIDHPREMLEVLGLSDGANP